MDFLELNIHQRILADIASNVGETVDDIHHTNTLIASLVQTRADVGEKLEESKYEESIVVSTKVFMPASRVLCNIAFGELVVNFPDNHIREHRYPHASSQRRIAGRTSYRVRQMSIMGR
ncbi:hypothetical protein FB446DRAFT_729613 [Lentinula raphanica]|nr:hypothetical protein FB446DRAFT_729613 [Lentinula raphanica]